MGIKNLFNDLKKIGKKKYFSRGCDEELYFTGNNVEIEITYINGHLDLIITHNGARNNYKNCPSLSQNCKFQITAILNSFVGLDVKCKLLSTILLETFE